MRPSELTLVERHFVARLVHTKEAEVTVLSHLTILRSIDNHWLVSGRGKLRGVSVVDGKRDGLTSKPVTDIVGITTIFKSAYRSLEGEVRLEALSLACSGMTDP